MPEPPDASAPAQPDSVSKKVTEENVFEFLKLEHLRLINQSSELSIAGPKLPVKAEIEARSGVGVSHNKKNIHVNVILDVTARPEEDEGADVGKGTSLLKFHIQYQCVFVLNGATPDEILEHVNKLANVGTLMVWPHLREMIQYLCGRMQLPALILPMFVTTAKGSSIGGTKIELQQIPIPPEEESNH
jgi:hypothetical protein